jgi:hypothetical protein
MIKQSKAIELQGSDIKVYPVCLGCLDFIKENDFYVEDDVLNIIYHLHVKCQRIAITEKVDFLNSPDWIDV